jgi:hypothetical protein
MQKMKCHAKVDTVYVALKVVGNESRGVAKVAYDRYWSLTVVIDVRFSFYLAAILDLTLFHFRSLQPNN